jgi:alanine racemase
MSPEAYRYDIMAEYNLEPEIYSFESLRQYLDFAADRETVPGIHIKADTGMHRLGFDAGDEQDIADLLSAYPQVRALSVFSHLAAGDDPQHDIFTQEQIDKFSAFAGKLSAGLGYQPMRHILNSSGIRRFPAAQFDMVRLGVGLYGIGVNEQEQQKLEQVIRLKTVISQVKYLQPGDSVGYGRSYVATAPVKIATVPVGYADGLRRSLSNGKGKMSISGNIVPIVGRICMDMTMLDVTNLNVEAGDEVLVIGDEYTVTDMARDLGTIPYEVLTGISERVKRIYIQE